MGRIFSRFFGTRFFGLQFRGPLGVVQNSTPNGVINNSYYDVVTSWPITPTWVPFLRNFQIMMKDTELYHIQWFLCGYPHVGFDITHSFWMKRAQLLPQSPSLLWFSIGKSLQQMRPNFTSWCEILRQWIHPFFSIQNASCRNAVDGSGPFFLEKTTQVWVSHRIYTMVWRSSSVSSAGSTVRI